MLSREPIRFDAEQAARLDLELRHGEGSWRGELQTCHLSGVSVRFDGGPALPLGTEVSLRIAGPTIDPALELAARVELRNDSEGGRIYGLWFVRRREVESRLLPALRAMVERRGAERVAADPEETLLVTLVDEGGRRLASQLAWLSTRGLEVRIPAADEAAWVEVERACALITLPQRPEPLALNVRLRSRRLAGRHALVGLELTEPETPAEQEAQRALAVLVELRQAALERRRAG